MELNGVCRQAVCSLMHSFVRPSLRPSRNVRLYTANKLLDLEAPIYAIICMLTSYVRLPMFIQIVNVLDLHFQGDIFELNTLASG